MCSVEDKLSRVTEELQTVRGEMAKLQTFTEHLRKFCESLQTQIRMMGTTECGGRGVDNRGPAPLPGTVSPMSFLLSLTPSPLPPSLSLS